MELILTREKFTDSSTIGTLAMMRDATTEPLCKILEDTDRGLTSAMSLGDIRAKKVYGKTAIPRGRYQVVVTYSNRFARPLPLLKDVPGYEGVRIHPGNTPADTDGCLLPGIVESKDFVGKSRIAFDMVFAIIQKALDSGKEVWITIQ